MIEAVGSIQPEFATFMQDVNAGQCIDLYDNTYRESLLIQFR